MKLKEWLTFSVAVALAVVLFMGVVQLATFNKQFSYKSFGSSSTTEAPRSVVPLSNNRFAVVENGGITVYDVDGQGKLSALDRATFYRPRDNEENGPLERHNQR